MGRDECEVDKLIKGKTIGGITISANLVEIFLSNGTRVEITGGADQGANVVDIEINGRDFSRN